MMHNTRAHARRVFSRAVQTSPLPQSTLNAHIQSALTAFHLTTSINPAPFRSLFTMTRKQQQKYIHTLNQSMKLSKLSSSQQLSQSQQSFLSQPKNLAALMRTVPQSSLKGNTLRGITVGAAAEQYDESRQQKRDFSFTSSDIQPFHDQIVNRRVPFNSSTDIEFTLKNLKTTTIWTSNSLFDLITTILYAPWDAIQCLWSVGVKVYLRFTKQFDRVLTPWVYQLLDLKVPLEDLIFDIKEFSPEEHQLYLLITQVLRSQLVIELALKEAIQRAPIPEDFLRQQEDKAAQIGMSQDELENQLLVAQQAFQKQKIHALKQLQLIGIPDDFSPDEDTIEMIQNFAFPEDFPLEQIISEPRLGLELIRRLVTEQLAQIPMPQMSTLLEFKGLSQALRSLQQPEHFAEYRRLFTFVSSPDMTLRRQLRTLSVQGTSKDYERIRMSVMKQLQHMRRVMKTYQRQQQQIKEFGFIVKRRRNFNPNDPKLSRADRAVFLQDVERGIFASIDDVDPEEQAEGSLIANEPGFPDPNGNNRMSNKKRGHAELSRPLTQEDVLITLRILALTARRDKDSNFEITAEAISDPSNDEELLDTALGQFNGDVTALEAQLRPVFYDIQNDMFDDDEDDFNDDDDYDNEYNDDAHQSDAFPSNTNQLGLNSDELDYDPAQGLDPLLIDGDVKVSDEAFDNDKHEKEQAKKKTREDLQSRYRSDAELARDERRRNKPTRNGRPLPAHVVRDPNPKVVSRKWFSEASKHYKTYQERLDYIERLAMERDFETKDKYLAATRHFSTVLLDESSQRNRSIKLQEELQTHVKKMFDSLPEQVRQQYFQQRYEFEHRISTSSPEQQQQLKQQQQAEQQQQQDKLSASLAQSGANTVTAGKVNDLPDLSSLSSVPDHISSETASTSSPQQPQIDLSNIPLVFPTPKSRQDELDQTNDMLQVIQAYQLQSYRDQYALQELERAHQREELRIVGRNEDILQRANAQQRQKVEDARLLVAKQRLEQQRAIAQAEAEGKPIPELTPIASVQAQLKEQQTSGDDELDLEIHRIQQEIEKIDVTLTDAMAKRALQKAVQHTELPLLQQLSLLRMRTISNVELYNSEMLDIMYTSMRDFLQTALYDANQHNIVEHSVSGIMLTVLNSAKSVESYDDMTRFNERVEEQVNKPRAVVNKLSTLQRKWLLMSLQQEHQLNQFYPIGQLPPILPFLSNPERQAKMRRVNSEDDVLRLHEEEFNTVPLCLTKILDHIKVDHPFGHEATPTAIRNSVQDFPLCFTDTQLQEQVGDYLLSEQTDKFIVSPNDLTKDLFDSCHDIVSPKHLLNQLKRVRDRRLRELLQLVGMIGADPQVLASTTKFHIKQLEPAFSLSIIPENLVVYLTKYYTHRSIATTLEEMIRVLSSMRKQVTDKQVDYSLTEYDVTLQYCMDLYQYHIKQLQVKVPDFYNTQFRAIDLSMVGFQNAPKPWRPEFERPLSLKELTSASFGDESSSL